MSSREGPSQPAMSLSRLLVAFLLAFLRLFGYLLQQLEPKSTQPVPDDSGWDFVEPSSGSGGPNPPKPPKGSSGVRSAKLDGWYLQQAEAAETRPTCFHQQHCGLWMSRNEATYGRVFWRCSGTKKCTFFQWADYQPFEQTPSATSPASPCAAVSTCSHKNTSWHGSNGYVRRQKCVDCGLVLVCQPRQNKETEEAKA